MSRLFVIGNGFDLHFGLPTTTDDYVKILNSFPSVYSHSIPEELNKYGVCWRDFEFGLRELDMFQIEMDYIQQPDYLSDHEYDRDSGITFFNGYFKELLNAIYGAMYIMANMSNDLLFQIQPDNQLSFSREDWFLSFNYTLTLETLYNISLDRILHIHGQVPQDNKLIFGYGYGENDYKKELVHYDKDETSDFYISQQKHQILLFYENLKKNIQYGKLHAFIKYMDVEQIIVMGHSLSVVDQWYFEFLDDTFPQANWLLFFHTDEDVVLKNKFYYNFLNDVEKISW